MTKLVVLKLDGDFQKGVRVALSIANEGTSPYKEVTGALPPISELLTTIDQWRLNYRNLDNSTRALKALKVTYDGSITQKYSDCKNSASELKKQLNNWLRSEPFRSIRETWLKELREKDPIRVLIRTSSQQLRQIPWHLWDLAEEYPNAELALSSPDYQQSIITKTPTYRDKVKILAILGNSTGINVETDRQLLNSLPDALVTFLVQPQRHEINDSLWSEPWDILFFAGHSQTVEESGRIYINENKDSLTTDDLKYGLKKATSSGLALAIFNSCDGLGLASDLESLNIPEIIVMREPVPDEAAQAFLKHFLAAYAADSKPLYLAVKEARLRLHGIEDKYPCASWLPVICQNAVAIPPNWSDLGRRQSFISPYRGLFAFREEDAQFFFGRETFTQMLMESVQSQPFVAVIGSSGSGKTSVVFAGLVKRLRDTGNWHIVDFRPGERPLFNLATALVSWKETYLNRTDRLRSSIKNLATDLEQRQNALGDVVDDIIREDSSKGLLLVADQFEELYTLCTDAQERKAFLDRLLEAINHCRNFTFVITLRADFLGQALSYRPFADALQYADLKLGPMTDSELQAAIEKPAAVLGVTIEHGLVERVLYSVSVEPGDLPLLEFALTLLWVKQQDAQLTHAAYDEIGEVEAALARYADEVYNQLNFEEQERVQRIFIQLVHPGEGTEDTRRVATGTEIGEENWDLVTRLANARLVVTGRDEKALETVEIVHEALIRSWGQLQEWMQQDRNFRCWQESLRVAMRTWKSNSFDEGALLRGKPLSDAVDWYTYRLTELSNGERSYIQHSLELRQRESNQRQRRRQLIISGLTIALVLALGLAGVAWWQGQNSAENEIKATSASSEALFASNQELEGLTAAISAGKNLKKLPWFRADTQTTVVKVLEHLLYKIKEYNRLEGHIDGAVAVAFSWDEQMIATLSGDGTVKLWKSDGALLNKPWLKNLKDVSAVVFSPKNQIIATASVDKITLWTLDGKKQRTLSGNKGDVGAIAFSPNGKIIATASTKATASKKVGTVQLWNSESGTLLKTLEGVNQPTKVAFSPDGEMIAAGGWSGVKIWKTDGSLLPALKKYGGTAITALAFSPNGQIFAIGNANKDIYLWKKNSSGEYQTNPDKILQGHSDAIWGLSFSPNGEMIASASGDKTVKIWNPDGGLITTIKGHTDIVNAVAFSAKSTKLASASDDGSVKLWNLEGTVLKALEHTNPVYTVAFSPDGKKIFTTNGYGYVSFWQDNGKLLKTEQWQYGSIHTAALSPNQQLIVTASNDRSVQIRKFDGTERKFLEGHKGELNQQVIFGASFSPDSQMIATGDANGTVQMWTTDGKLYKNLQTSGDTVWAVSFSPDGKLIVVVDNNGKVKLWRRDGRLVKSWTGHKKTVNAVVFSNNGDMIATASADQTVKLWKRNASGEFETTPYKILAGHSDTVSAVAFSPNSQIIATASADKTVKLWNSDGKLLKTLFGHKDKVNAIVFKPDGKILASGSKDGSVILWDLDLDLNLDTLLKMGCDWTRNYFDNNRNTNSNRHLCD